MTSSAPTRVSNLRLVSANAFKLWPKCKDLPDKGDDPWRVAQARLEESTAADAVGRH